MAGRSSGLWHHQPQPEALLPGEGSRGLPLRTELHGGYPTFDVLPINRAGLAAEDAGEGAGQHVRDARGIQQAGTRASSSAAPDADAIELLDQGSAKSGFVKLGLLLVQTLLDQ